MKCRLQSQARCNINSWPDLGPKHLADLWGLRVDVSRTLWARPRNLAGPKHLSSYVWHRVKRACGLVESAPALLGMDPEYCAIPVIALFRAPGITNFGDC